MGWWYTYRDKQQPSPKLSQTAKYAAHTEKPCRHDANRCTTSPSCRFFLQAGWLTSQEATQPHSSSVGVPYSPVHSLSPSLQGYNTADMSGQPRKPIKILFRDPIQAKGQFCCPQQGISARPTPFGLRGSQIKGIH